MRMLDLTSEAWRSLRGPAGHGQLAADLLTRLGAGDDSVLGELFEQACHQFTSYEVGFAVVPHLVELAEQRPSVEFRVEALKIIGAVMAAKVADRRARLRSGECARVVPCDHDVGYGIAGHQGIGFVARRCRGAAVPR
jgi:hypothetical protein